MARRRAPTKGGEGAPPLSPPPGPRASPTAPAPHGGPAAPEPSPVEAAVAGLGISWGTRARWAVIVAAAIGALLYLTSSVISVLIAAAVIAYLLDRPVSWLAKKGLSREAAFVVLLLVATGGLLLAALVVVPLVVHQLGELATNFTPYLANLAEQIAPYRADLEARLGVAIPLDLSSLADVAPQYLQKLADVPNAGQLAKDLVARVAGGGAQVVVSALTLALLPLFSFYVCRDWPEILRAVEGLVPPRWRPPVREIAEEIDRRTMAFVQGQMILCLLLGALYSAGLLVAGIDLAVVVGMSSGVLFLVPYVGTLAGMTLSSVLALLKFGFDWHVVVCVLTYVGVQVLEGSVLTPKIVGDRVGLHPLVVMIGVVVFGDLLGVWGLMAAVPLTAALSVLGAALVDAWRKSRVYRG